MSGPERSCTTQVTLTKVNLEERQVLAKLLEAIRRPVQRQIWRNPPSLGGNAMGPESMAPVTKLEKAKAKELATKLG